MTMSGPALLARSASASSARTDDKSLLLDWIDRDRDRLIRFLSEFIQAKSPHPPGDTRLAVAHVTRCLRDQDLTHRTVAGREDMPNIVGTLNFNHPGNHLSLIGHLDVFPVADTTGWIHDPWSGRVENGRIYGRGAADMKSGSTAMLFAYGYLSRLRERLKGELTLALTSDEESGGEWGAGYLVKHVPEVLGDCCITAEPSSRHTLRFGQKGSTSLEFKVVTPGAHGAYENLSKSAVRIAADIITELDELRELQGAAPPEVSQLLSAAGSAADKALGPGGSKLLDKLTVNVAPIHGGVKRNVIARSCEFQVSIRIPPGLTTSQVIDKAQEIANRRPESSMRVINRQEPIWSDPNHKVVWLLQDNAKRLQGYAPAPIISLGGSDLTWWRERNIPSYYYGPMNRGMGTVNEYVEIEEFIYFVKVHALTAYDYLTRNP